MARACSGSIQGVTVLGDRYELFGDPMGGGQALVYVGRDRRLGTKVAVKFPRFAVAEEERPGMLARLDRERIALAKVRHNNLAMLLDAGVGVPPGGHEESPYFVLGFLEGENLRTELRRVGRLDADTAARALFQVLDALGALHAQGIWHRDVKPSNVMDDGRGKFTLIDLGIAKVLGESILTNTGHTMGTSGYAAPEQLRGEGDLDGRADIFAAGCLMFHMLTGRAPFDESNPVVSYQQRMAPAPGPSLLADDPGVARFDELVGRAMAFDPDDRFDTVADMQEALVRASEPAPTTDRTRVIPNDRRFPDGEPVEYRTAQLELVDGVPEEHRRLAREARRLAKGAAHRPRRVFEESIQAVADGITRKAVRTGVWLGVACGVLGGVIVLAALVAAL